VSVSIGSPGTISTGSRAPARRETNLYRAFAGVILALDLVVLAVLALNRSDSGDVYAIDLLAWILLAIAASLAPVPSGRGAWLAFDLPIVLGAGLVFGPLGAGLVGLIGAWDIREIRKELSLSRALFNRAQVSLSGIAGAWAFELLGGDLSIWPAAAFVGLAALATDCLVNYMLVAASSSITFQREFKEVLAEMYVGTPRGFLAAYVSFGFLSVLVAEAYRILGLGGLIAFAIPLLLARQLFLYRHELASVDTRLRERQSALQDLQSSIADERRDERMVLAGELHDEVLPPLFKVHLMGQVLKQDLSTGRLLDLDEDLPQLIEATELAQSAVRDLVRTLRKSTLGPGGLGPTLVATAKQLEGAGSPRIALEIADVGASHEVQLVLYQAAREAMGNAAKYSRAEEIVVKLARVGDEARLTVLDGGVGFNPAAVDLDTHFGLQFVAERVEALGGRVVVDSLLGSGTTVAVIVPLVPRA
jgi:signal transduction histidine kinase